MKKHSGYSLIELSVALVVLGIIIVLIWRFVGFNMQYALSNSQRDLLRSADAAVTGFALSHSRLPCPDTDGDGSEDCGGSAAVGRLPVVSIGLAQANAGLIRYGVYRNASGTAVGDADLATAKDRIPMLATTGTPLAGYDFYNAQSNGIDLCAGLRTAARSAASTSVLYAATPEGNINVAYALAVAGRADADQAGGLLDDTNAVSGAGFEAPSRVTDGGYDDRVVAVGFDRLMRRLGCNGALAAAVHAHANAATMAEITRQAMLDYKIQLDLQEKLAEANKWAAAAAIAIAAAGAAAGAAEVAEGLAESLVTNGAEAEVEALAVIAEAAALVGVGLAAAEEVPAENAYKDAQANVAEFLNQAFVARSQCLATQIRANANAADAAGTWTSGGAASILCVVE
ncbi:MAG TPA: prepilin-type N-terminal cleavage/methylation domain-containing protein [Rhodanobacteraceae bacterium]|nr:prepilin-type N-terminal cleavage/methylation domain-containing protein [Rhodanobacteraceae bacterium]